MRAIVTGVGGFVGPHLVRQLQATSGGELVGFARRPVKLEGVETAVVDLVDRDAVFAHVHRVQPTHVFHLAAQSHVPSSHRDPAATITNNFVGQLNLLDACSALSQRPRVLIVGSAEEYGLARADEMPLREDQPFRPTSPYAVSKVAQDLLGWQYFVSYGLPVVRVRPFNHTGPEQSNRFVVSAFAGQVAAIEAGCSEPVIYVGNLEAQRDFLDVRDVVSAYQAALTRGEPGAVYNVGRGEAISIHQVLEMLLAMSAATIDVRQEPDRMRPSDVPILVANTEALRAATGWAPTISFAQSVADTLNWWRARMREAPPSSPRDGAPVE